MAKDTVTQSKAVDFDKTITVFGVKIHIQIAFPGYWEIIGGHIHEVIGVTTDRESVLAEEPKAYFRRITKKQFEQFSKDH